MTITGSRLPASSLLGCDVGRPGRQHLEPLAAERQFFKALLEADGPELDRVLADDFLLIDVLSGSEFQKPTLLASVGSCQVKFEKIDLLESPVRRYPGIAIVTGRTPMPGRFAQSPFS